MLAEKKRINVGTIGNQSDRRERRNRTYDVKCGDEFVSDVQHDGVVTNIDVDDSDIFEKVVAVFHPVLQTHIPLKCVREHGYLIRILNQRSHGERGLVRYLIA